MLFRIAAYVLLIFLVPACCFSQQYIKGKIYSTTGDEVVASVTVQNISARRFNISDASGNFRIQAEEGDTLVFSSVTYLADTVVVSFFMFKTDYDISLRPHVVTLSSVTVGGLTNYQIDSINRRDYYKDFYKGSFSKVAMDKGTRKGDGVGVSFSGLNYFSTGEKQKRELKHQLEQDEKEKYIDSRFSPLYISKLTRLQGDSLKEFMLLYRPNYAFCRKASSEDMLLYINDSVRKFMHKSPE